MAKTYNDALEWAATWIEDTLQAGPETNERTIEFGTNMAMTLRAAKLSDADPPRATADDQALKKLAARVIDAVLQSPVVVETRCFSQPQEVDRLETQVVALLAAAPRATGEIEACLAELREMFPGKVILVRREDSFYPPDCRDAAETNSMVTIKIGYLESEPKFRSFRSLADCMTQVRAARKGKERIREQNS
jgi:hypothetical protein